MASLGFIGGSVTKNLPANARDMGSIPGSGRSPGERNGNPLQYSCLGNPIDKGAWRATVHGVTKVGHDLATNNTNNNGISISPTVYQTLKGLEGPCAS